MSAAELFEKAKALPIEERAELYNRLCENLAEEGYDFDPDLTPEQIAELERRAEELRKNPQVGIPWEVVREDMRKRHGWK
jgi:putative addiction module component (TIGR02574 family)